jgi:hypothetical protein
VYIVAICGGFYPGKIEWFISPSADSGWGIAADHLKKLWQPLHIIAEDIK